MNIKDREAFKKLIAELRKPQAQAFSSHPDFEEGIDYGRDDTADQIEYLIKQLDAP